MASKILSAQSKSVKSATALTEPGGGSSSSWWTCATTDQPSSIKRARDFRAHALPGAGHNRSSLGCHDHRSCLERRHEAIQWTAQCPRAPLRPTWPSGYALHCPRRQRKLPLKATSRSFARKHPFPQPCSSRSPTAAEPGVILTVRREHMRTHAGQVAFPGGRLDAGEDPTAAALREAHEELLLKPGSVEIVGTLDEYRTVTGYVVTPVIGVIPPRPTADPARR